MISKSDLERILAHHTDGVPVLSLFLDMSVNSDNKRTHRIFLNQRRAQFDEIDSARQGAAREDLDRVMDRVEGWLASDFQEENRGVAIYADLNGDWFESFQFPISVANRMVIGQDAAIGPLAQVIETYHHHGVILLDREHVRILSVYLGTLMKEIEVHGEPYPARHDLQAGGYSQTRFQRRKQEETKHFFKEFVREVELFVRRHEPDDLVILGTDENVAKFREFLPDAIQQIVSYTGHMAVDGSTSEILERLEPHLDAERERESQAMLEKLRQRVEQDYLAAAGFQSTLTALQEGKVDTLIVGTDQEQTGARCTQCGFLFGRNVERCPYDGSAVEDGVDVVEAAIRLAEQQGSDVEFVPAGDLTEMAGVGALLRF